jgi:hypothetical protein
MPARAGPLAILCVALLAGLGAHSGARAGALSDATSPYLLAHADDAIEWTQWRRDALERARRDDKLIFVSIGYSACHWCHVMARKTFADERVIGLLNENFVTILIDREERPDLDAHFMPVMATLHGPTGSPANFVLTPDLEPLYAVGYLGPDREFGRPGLVTNLQSMVTSWNEDRDTVRRDVSRIREALASLQEPILDHGPTSRPDPREAAARAWSAAFDPVYGGLGAEPKFPRANVLSFLLRHAVWTGDDVVLDEVYRTLDAMAAGGIRDQLGGMFHRYTVDRAWWIPHFEIMLEGNALLARVYLAAYQASGRERYATIAREILADMMARLHLPGGGFATALDAETEGVDGLFYTWTADEVRAVLGQDAAPFISAYVDEVRGAVDGRGVLRLRDSQDDLVGTQQRLAASRASMRAAREQRPPPFRDEKVVTSWNALAVSALAHAARVFDDARYSRIAQDEMTRLLRASDDLRHSHYDGRAAEEVFLDDYAFLAEALIDLYETDFRPERLDDARALLEVVLRRFERDPGNGFRLTPRDRVSAIAARGVVQEGDAPSGNAAILTAMHRLSLYGAESVFEAPAAEMVRDLGATLDIRGAYSSGLLKALAFQPDEAHEIVIVGLLENEDTQHLLRIARRRVLHGTVLAVIPPDAELDNKAWALLSSRPQIDGKATAYVCHRRLCDLPVNQPSEFGAQLDRLVSSP